VQAAQGDVDPGAVPEQVLASLEEANPDRVAVVGPGAPLVDRLPDAGEADQAGQD
jgi:hypothetical protein